MKSVFVGCGLAALMIAASASAGVKEGVEAWLAGNYPKAIAEWRGPAAAGDADAQFNLGQAYKLGRGVTADPALALDWYRKAATAGHEQAQATLGLQLFQSGKRDEAMTWLKKAADQGEPRAQYVVGTAYFNGDSLPKDWARAYAMMTRAKSAGIGAASTSLTQMDQLIPDAQKQAGLSLAREMERTQQLRVSDSASPDAPLTLRSSVADRTPTPVGQTSVPPSAPPPPPPVSTASNQPWRAPATKAAPSIPAPAASTPAPVAAAATPPKLKAVIAPSAGGWRIQLGAFSSADSARVQWTSISAKAGLKALTPTYTPVGNLTRLQAGPFASRGGADQACAAVKAAGSGCFSVAP